MTRTNAEAAAVHTKAVLRDLYETHHSFLYNYMFNLTRNREEAADLVQEVFLRLCRQAWVPEQPKTWLFRTGYRLFVDQWRRRQRYMKLQLGRETVELHTPEQALIDKEFGDAVRAQLERLKPLSQAAFHMRVYREYSLGEISRALDCSENTVKSCIRRGRKQLAGWLRAYGDSR